MNRLYSFSIFVAAVALIGCGGGSNGSKGGKGILTLSFVAGAGTASGPVGNSHVITVYRNDGTIIDTKTVDTSSGSQTLNLTGLPSGTLRLHIGLAASAGGAEIGAVDTTFQGGTAATPMSFAMRQSPAVVAVAPATATVNVGSTLPLYAAAKDVGGDFIYEAPTAWTWTSGSPGFATVDATGTVTGVAEGGASIQASLNGSGLSATSALNILPNGVRHGKWTVMVFLNASNNLYPYALPNINQMERIADNPDVRFVVQWKQVQGVGGNASPSFSGTRRYLANFDKKSALASTMVEDLGGGVDMGSESALNDFVTWTKAKYPADHYALVLWNHGAGWNTPRVVRPVARGISYDDESGNHLDLPDVAHALTNARVDILAYDACLMQGAEDLIELSTDAGYIVASEENTPGPGFAYDKMFAAAEANADVAPADLAAAMPAAFTSYYATNPSLGYSGWALHLSALDTSKVAPFRTALDNFSLALTADAGENVTNPGSGTPMPLSHVIRNSCIKMDPSFTTYSYYDLDQLAQNAASLSANATVKTTANLLRTALGNLVVANSTSPSGTYMKALSIEFAKSSTFEAYATEYNSLQIARLTHWSEFLASAANP